MEEAALRTATVVPPDELNSSTPPPQSSPPGNRETPRSSRPSRGPWPWFIIPFGVVLPLLTLGIELYTHQCAGVFFDPLPTWLHVLLVALVPASNLATLLLAHTDARRRRWLAHANAAAIAVAALYTAAYAPLMPIAIIAVWIMGWGLLPLTPFLSLLAAISARRFLRRAQPANAEPLPPLWKAGAVAAALVMLTPVHAVLTTGAMNAATTGTPLERSIGLAALRIAGDRETMLQACYRNPGQTLIGDLLNFRVRQEDAQKLYYRVTGEAFNAVPVPLQMARGRMSADLAWRPDAGLGGEIVANRVQGLSMNSSRLDGKVNVAAGTSYTEWTMVFKNVAADVSEARAQIELPQGAVVSRLTLWINGEPQEAAFGGRSQVRKAYQEVAVVQRRDPVLVTTSGPNRVLMQCFPVPAKGEMKIRIGITAPLHLSDRDHALVRLPRLLETNFELPDRFPHELWLESDRPLSLDGAAPTAVLRTSLKEERLRERPRIEANRTGAPSEVWTDDPTDSTWVIRQTIQEQPVSRPSRIALVVDGSGTMSDELKDLSNALAAHEFAQTELAIFFAGDEVDSWRAGEGKESAARWLKGKRWSTGGGRDNLAALQAAWDYATEKPDGALIWIHGTQPVLLGSAEPLLQRIERDRHHPRIYDLPIAAGANRILDSFSDFPAWITADTEPTVAGSLDHLLAKLLAPDSREFIPVRTRMPRGELTEALGQADRHVARLWSAEEVDRLRFSNAEGGLHRAVKLAIQMQLVTPVSGAVVLERKEQYQQHGLEPVDSSAVPTVPEPGIGALAASGLAMLLGFRRARRRPPVVA